MRCITYKGRTYNYETGNSWNFNYEESTKNVIFEKNQSQADYLITLVDHDKEESKYG